MIPAEYRLERVVAALVERLDGARRSYPDEAELRAGAERVAAEHVDAAIAEWSATGFSDTPQAHAAFLRREVLETALPRFVREAARMNRSEASGHGLGPLATPVGRVGLVAFALAFLWFVLLRFAYMPAEWPLIALDLSLPFWPDIAAWLSRRRYQAALQGLVDDTRRIQEQALVYEAPTARPAGQAGSGAQDAVRHAPPTVREGQ